MPQTGATRRVSKKQQQKVAGGLLSPEPQTRCGERGRRGLHGGGGTEAGTCFTLINAEVESAAAIVKGECTVHWLEVRRTVHLFTCYERTTPLIHLHSPAIQ